MATIKSSKGFSLVEVIVSIFVLGTLASSGWFVWHQKKVTYQRPVASASINAAVTGQKKTTTSNPAAQQLPLSTTQTQTQKVIEPTPGIASGTFIQQENSKWPSGQTTIYIGVSVNNAKEVSKVEWYSNNTLLFTQESPSAGDLKDNGALYQFNWDVSGLAPGTYRVTARVYDTNGYYQLVKNNLGNPYLDTTIKEN